MASSCLDILSLYAFKFLCFFIDSSCFSVVLFGGEHRRVNTAQNCRAMFHTCRASDQPQCELNFNSKSFIPDDAITRDDLPLRVKNQFAKLAIRLLVSKVSAYSILLKGKFSIARK